MITVRVCCPKVLTADVTDVIETAVGGKAVTQVTEGERLFDLTLRWPARLRRDEQSILSIPVDVAIQILNLVHRRTA